MDKQTMGILVSSLAVCIAFESHAADPAVKDLLKAKPDAVKAWKDMRFGMFLCWGPVSLTGQEIGWSRGVPASGRRKGVRGGKGVTPAAVYDNLYMKWKPDKFDAEQWVKIAKAGGMKYLIFLVKHHDGFCLYDTKLTDYKSTGPASAWPVDVMKHVADACHKHDLKLIVYYSQPDWHHPDYLGEHHERYVQYLHGQVRELLTNYGKIDGLWFDNLRGHGRNAEAAKLWAAENLFKMARSIQPHLIINDRCGLDGDYYTPEQHVGRFQNDHPWESCITLGTQWSWKPKDKLKPYTDGLRMLIVCAIGDGNLALNTNSMPDGRIEPRQVESFRKIGQWLEKHGESIYGTRGGPFVSPNMNARKFGAARHSFALPAGQWWGGSTRKGNVVYLHILRWPSDTIMLPNIGREIITHTVLTGGQATVTQNADGIQVSVPSDQRDRLDTIVKLELDGSAMDIAPRSVVPAQFRGAISIGKKAIASGVWPGGQYNAAMALDGDPSTRWGGAQDSRSGWLAIDLGKPMAFNRVVILEEPWNRVQKFELQIKDGDNWKVFHEGATLGNFSKTFKTITAQEIRLNILEASNVPTLWEFQLLEVGRTAN